jgi:chromosome segregation ATPase
MIFEVKTMKMSKLWQKVTVALLSLVVLLFAGYGVKTAADHFWGGHEAVRQINRNVDTLSDNLHQRTAKLKDASEDLDDAQDRNERLEKELLKKQKALKLNEQWIKELSAKIDALTRDNKQLSFKNAAEVAKYEKSIKELNNSLADLQTANDVYTKQVGQLQEDNNDARREVDRLSSDVKQKEQTVTALRKDLTTAETAKAQADLDNSHQAQLLRQAEKDAKDTLKKTEDALDDNDLD